MKVSLDGGSYTGKEILQFDPTATNLAAGRAAWKGETFIQNAITNSVVRVYIKATLTTKKSQSGLLVTWAMIDPVSLGLSEQAGGLINFTSNTDYLEATYLIEASTSPTSGFTPYLDFYDAYPTPPGPLPGQGIGAAYSSINNGFYWSNCCGHSRWV